MDSKLRKLLEERDNLLSQLRDVEEFIRLYQKFFPTSDEALMTEMGERPNNEAEEQTVAEPTLEAQDTSVEPPRRGYTKEMLKPHLREVILQAGRPLTRSQLLKALDTKGIPVGGTNRPKNMGTIMWRLGNDFVSLEGFGYWPSTEPYSPAGYDPTAAKLPQASSAHEPQDEFEGL